MIATAIVAIFLLLSFVSAIAVIAAIIVSRRNNRVLDSADRIVDDVDGSVELDGRLRSIIESDK